MNWNEDNDIRNEVTGPLVQADVPDSQGDMFPRLVLKKAVEEIQDKLPIPLTRDFNEKKILGQVTRVEIHGDCVSAYASDLDDKTIESIIGKELEFTIGGTIHKAHKSEHDGKPTKVIDELELKYITLSDNKVK